MKFRIFRIVRYISKFGKSNHSDLFSVVVIGVHIIFSLYLHMGNNILGRAYDYANEVLIAIHLKVTYDR